MKALFISYNQALTERVASFLDHMSIRGYTMFPLTHGRGSFQGEPHMGTHTWPAMNSSVIAIIDDAKAKPALEALRKIDEDGHMQGIRAFVWDVTDAM